MGINKTVLLRYCIPLIALIIISFSCNRNKKPVPPPPKKETVKVNVPVFNSDSAYHFVERQVAFGPRVPNTEAHKKCAVYLENKLREYTPDVFIQNAKVRVYNGQALNCINIIGSFKPDLRKRVLLAAHWDSRPYADHDENMFNRREPIDGANDGASGVGVLLEIARLLSENESNIGVDIIFFDVEDYGPPEDAQLQGENENWALGSQYWSKNPHIPGYSARFGILLDMVGAENPRFAKEGYSNYYAPDIVKKVWDKAKILGYDAYFINETGPVINDDHIYVNQIRRIPMIDIIHLDPESSNGTFFEYWHTTGDNMEAISKYTLGVVGQTVLAVIYNEK